MQKPNLYDAKDRPIAAEIFGPILRTKFSPKRASLRADIAAVKTGIRLLA